MKISFLTALSLSCAISLGICSSSASAIQYYKWVDAKGTTHYTKTPPPKTAKKATTVDTYGWKNSAPTPPRTNGQKLKCKQKIVLKNDCNSLKFLRIRISSNVKPTKP